MASKVFSTVVLGVALSAAVTRAQSNGTTTRYWDCCKQSCGWSGKADVIQPVTSCDASGNQLTDYDAVNGCDGGNAYTCNDNSPWAINDTLAYGFAAVDIAGSSESGWCCQCYELTFTSTAIAGKRMIVQATNTGGDLGNNQFDLLIPGGGVGIFTAGCPAEFGAWNGGATYGGVSNSTQCSQLPAALQAGCNFRFDWMQGVDNPTMSFTPTTCPSELVAKSGCQRNDSGPLTTLSPSNSTSASTSSTTTSSSTASSTTSSTVNSTVSSTSSTDATTTTIAGAGTAVRYAQCAGKGYSGPTVCASPYTCTYQNDYYSQCL